MNELSNSKRIMKENVILAGLWFRPSDPAVNLFLQPIYDQLEELGQAVNLIVPDTDELQTVTASLLCGTCDAPARADFLNHVRFNGNHGCPRCLSKGYNIKGEDFGNTHIYPFDGDVEHRSMETYEAHSRSANTSNKPEMGVKGSTLLAVIMIPDFIRGTAIDVMHCVYLGVIKKFTEIWLDSASKYDKFSLHDKRKIIDARKNKAPKHCQANASVFGKLGFSITQLLF